MRCQRGFVAGAAAGRSRGCPLVCFAAKGFGTKSPSKPSAGSDGGALKDGGDVQKKVVREAASSATKSRSYRPIRPEEAARGKLDYVRVADWGDGDRSKLGELQLVEHVEQFRGSGTEDEARVGGPAGDPAAAGGKAGPAVGIKPFHQLLVQQLQQAEARGALAVAGPPPPPLEEWSFAEARYRAFLTDLYTVHSALEAALTEATAALTISERQASGVAASTSAAAVATATTTTAAASTQEAQAPEGASGPQQCALHGLLHLAPGRLGLERSGALLLDLQALQATSLEAVRAAEQGEAAGPPGSVAGAGSSSPRGGGSRAGGSKAGGSSGVGEGGPMARSYAQVLRRLGRQAACGETDEERQGGALRLLAHAAVLHLVAQAVWVRLGARATERLALLQRRAAATYHDYPPQVADPRVTLHRALDAAGAHLRAAPARQVVYDEVAGAMQKTGLLLTALAHRN